MGKKYSGQKIKDVPTAYVQLGPTDFPRSLLPKQRMDYLNDKNNVRASKVYRLTEVDARSTQRKR